MATSINSIKYTTNTKVLINKKEYFFKSLISVYHKFLISASRPWLKEQKFERYTFYILSVEKKQKNCNSYKKQLFFYHLKKQEDLL